MKYTFELVELPDGSAWVKKDNDTLVRVPQNVIDFFASVAEIKEEVQEEPKKTTPKKNTTKTGVTLSEVREWALENGLTTSSRGLISQKVREAYMEAHPDHIILKKFPTQ